MISIQLDKVFDLKEIGSFSLFVFFFTFLPGIAVSVRRLHDVNKSGWWLLISLTGIGNFLLLYWFLLPSDLKKITIIEKYEVFMDLIDKSLFKQQCYINGEWTNSETQETFNVINPSDQNIIGTMPNCKKKETSDAIESARSSWGKWKNFTGKERSSLIRAWHELILKNIDDLSLIMTLENGKPLSDAKGEILYASWFTDWFAGKQKNLW